MEWVGGIEGNRFGCSLGTRPEWSAVGGDHICREVVQQLLDVVVEVLFEAHASPQHTLFELDWFFGYEATFDAVKSFQLYSRGLLLQALEKS